MICEHRGKQLAEVIDGTTLLIKEAEGAIDKANRTIITANRVIDNSRSMIESSKGLMGIAKSKLGDESYTPSYDVIMAFCNDDDDTEINY
jgi:hypothetical protein